MDVEAADKNAPEFEPNASVYARNNGAAESARGAFFQVGLTAPPRLPPPPAQPAPRTSAHGSHGQRVDADQLFLSKLAKAPSGLNEASQHAKNKNRNGLPRPGSTPSFTAA